MLLRLAAFKMGKLFSPINVVNEERVVIILKGRMAVASHVLGNVLSRMKSEGQFELEREQMPAHWRLEADGLVISQWVCYDSFSRNRKVEMVLDIWPIGRRKVLSIRWLPGQPPLVRSLGSFKAGEWLNAFGVVYQPMRGAKRLQLH